MKPLKATFLRTFRSIFIISSCTLIASFSILATFTAQQEANRIANFLISSTSAVVEQNSIAGDEFRITQEIERTSRSIASYERTNPSIKVSIDNRILYLTKHYQKPIFPPVILSQNKSLQTGQSLSITVEMPVNIFSLEQTLSFLITGSIIAILMFIVYQFSQTVFKRISTDIASISEIPDVNSIINLRFHFSETHKIAETLHATHGKLETERAEKTELSRSAAANAAIARTTQMLAHDVRKPFTMLQATLNMLHKARTFDEFQKIRSVAIGDVQRAMSSVNGLLADVMEISAESTPTVEATNPATFIEASLTELFRIFHNAEVDLVYSLTHSRTAMADTTKLTRVFSNILGNALQAMNHKGSLHISTRDVVEHGKPFIEFSLKNSGPHIPSSDLSQIFDAFFTKNKKGGTGLGLAIAQRVVTLHGGKIRCESAPNKGVTFVFTIPAGEPIPLTTTQSALLPATSAEFYASQKTQETKQISEPLSSQANAGSLILEIERMATNATHPIHVHVVDDEPLYRNAVAHALPHDLQTLVRIHTHSNASSLWEGANSHAPHLIVLDVDLGPACPSGFEIASQIRARGIKSFVCIHTNRVMAADNRAALDSGADAFLPKPLSELHLLKLLAQAVERGSKSDATPTAVAQISATHIAVVDDDALILMGWEMAASQTACTTFTSPEEFFEKLAANANLATSIGTVVTDLHFDNSEKSGIDLAAEIKLKYPHITVHLSTNATISAQDAGPNIATILPKNAEDALAILAAKA